MYEVELYHHGIKGQKWGIRRFQNKDGSLTRLGLKRMDKTQRTAIKAEKKQARQEARAIKIEQRKAKQEAQKDQVKALFGIKSAPKPSADRPTNENDINARFEAMTGRKPKSAGRGGISELAGLAGVAGVVGGGMALAGIHGNSLKKPDAFEGKKPERPTRPNDVLTDDAAMKSWSKARGLYEKDLKDYNADKAEHDAKMTKYKDAMKGRFDLTKSSLEATKNVSSNVTNMMEKANRQKAEKQAASMDLSHLSTKELRDYVDRYNAEQSFRRVSAEQMNSGRSKTMEIIETIGTLAGVGASVVGVYAAYKQLKG